MSGPQAFDHAGSVDPLGSDLAGSCLASRALTSLGLLGSGPQALAGSVVALRAQTSLGLDWGHPGPLTTLGLLKNLHGLLNLWAICSVSEQLVVSSG